MPVATARSMPLTGLPFHEPELSQHSALDLLEGKIANDELKNHRLGGQHSPITCVTPSTTIHAIPLSSAG